MPPEPPTPVPLRASSVTTESAAVAGAPGRDLMLKVPEPRDVSWQPAGEAPKARKGIEHLEKAAPTKLERSSKGGSLWKATY